MHYTPHQYHKVQQQFLQQFKLRSQEFYDQNVNSQSLIQYKKLINLIQSNRKQTLKKKERLLIIKQKNISSQYDPVISQINQQQQKQIQQDDEDFQNGFYITENIQTSIKKPQQSQKKLDLAFSQARSISSKLRQSTINMQSRIMGCQINQNLNLDSIQDRIYTQYNVLESLSHEQSQVQQSIFCFKRRISDLQQQLSAQNMKSKQIERLFVQNNNEMMHVKYTNQQVKSAFTKTKKHFNLDLQGRKQIQQKFSQMNKTNFQQSIVNYIYLQKMKQKISQQQKLLIELDQKKEQLDDKQKKYHLIYEKEQQFFKIYDTIIKINPNNMIKDRVISILEKEFDQFEENNENKKIFKSLKSTKKLKLQSKSSFNLLNQSPMNKEQSLVNIVEFLINLFKKLKHESVQRASEFKILISQKDQKEKQLTIILQKVNQMYDFYGQKIQPKSEDNRTELNKLINKSKQIQQKCQRINTITINIEERIAFCLSRYLTLLQTVIRSFLKHDKESVKFFQSLLKKTFEVPKLSKILKNKKNLQNLGLEDGQLHIQDSRNLLINSFQNWENYIPYLYVLHESKYIQNFISQKKLLKFFKRIIKTKLSNKQIPTQIIFEKAITDIFEQSKQYHLSKIRKLLQILKELCSYIFKVKNGSIKIHCTISYESFQKIQETNLNEESSKNPSQKQLIRSSSNKSKNSLNQKTLPFIVNPPTKTQKNLYRQNQIFHTFSSTQKHLQPNNPNQISFMSKLKKKKQLVPVLNIHQFYEQMREEMQKVHKMSLN